MKRLLLIAFLSILLFSHAQVRIGAEDALLTAQKFLKQSTKAQDASLSLTDVINSKQSGLPNLFVFSLASQGFVIVSAMNEVLAYSLETNFPATDSLPSNIAYWLELYNNATDYLTCHPTPGIKRRPLQTPVQPLLNSTWGQDCFYNEACPIDPNGYCAHTLAGCIPVAMAQIMYFHKYPAFGCGTMSYQCNPYGTLSADFGQTTYQWDKMCDNLHESNPYVALLISHCGISIQTEYGTSQSVAGINNTVHALANYYYYPSSTIARRSNMGDEEWLCLIKNDLDQRLPILYTGTSLNGAHAFVCDGYDENGFFHFNFGWNGEADGYYTIEAPQGFSSGQNVIHNICPISNYQINSDTHGIIYVSPNGTGDGTSWEQSTSELQKAIYKSSYNDDIIWVKNGNYVGNTANDYAFTVYGNCKLYGGFIGDEPWDYDISTRNPNEHPSILNGQGKQGVVTIEQCHHPTIIDGFNIQNGSASQGGGIHLKNNTRIKNCRIHANKAQNNGGGIYIEKQLDSTAIVIEDCEIYSNTATNGGATCDNGSVTYLRCNLNHNKASKKGGGIYCPHNDSPSQFINCKINNNQAIHGGGCFTDATAIVTLWSCLINNNTAEIGGGCHIKGKTNLYNCTIVKNDGTNEYGGVYVESSTEDYEIKNCILWGNISQSPWTQIGPQRNYAYCAVQDDLSGSQLNYSADIENDGENNSFYIRFENSDVIAGYTGHGGDWRLQTKSTCIDRVESISNQPLTDLDGNLRLRHQKVDIGAYETNAAAYVISIDYCNQTNYLYNNICITSPGTYSFYYPGLPYDSLVIVQMDAQRTITEQRICDGDSYNFYGTLLHETGCYSKLLGCTLHELFLYVDTVSTIKLQEEICPGGTFDFYGTSLSQPGHYTFYQDCIKYELDLSVIPNPIVTMEEDICEGESFDFFGTLLNKPGRYFTNIDCQTSYLLNLNVNPLPPLQCSNDTIIDIGNTIQLTASGADSYLWSTGETTDRITVMPFTNATYDVIGYYNTGCKKRKSIKVGVNDQADEVIIYPNPAASSVDIYTPLIEEVNVYSLFGDRIAHYETPHKTIIIDVSQLDNGLYIIHVRKMKKHYYKRLVVLH